MNVRFKHLNLSFFQEASIVVPKSLDMAEYEAIAYALFNYNKISVSFKRNFFPLYYLCRYIVNWLIFKSLKQLQLNFFEKSP